MLLELPIIINGDFSSTRLLRASKFNVFTSKIYFGSTRRATYIFTNYSVCNQVFECFNFSFKHVKQFLIHWRVKKRCFLLNSLIIYITLILFRNAIILNHLKLNTNELKNKNGIGYLENHLYDQNYETYDSEDIYYFNILP